MKKHFKVEDLVYCKLFGRGIVTLDSLNNNYDFPIEVEFQSGFKTFTFDGRRNLKSHIVLFKINDSVLNEN